MTFLKFVFVHKCAIRCCCSLTWKRTLIYAKSIEKRGFDAFRLCNKAFINPVKYLGLSSPLLGLAWCSLKKAKCETVSNSANTAIDVSQNSENFFTVGNTNSRLTWYDIWLLLKADLVAIVAALSCAVATAGFNIQIPLLISSVINVIARSNGVTLEELRDSLKSPVLHLLYIYLAQNMFYFPYSIPGRFKDFPSALQPEWLVAPVVLAITTFAYISLLSFIGERCAERLRKQLFSSFIQQDIAFFDQRRTGELVNRLSADVQEFKSAFKQCVSTGVKSGVMIVGSVGSLLLISAKLTAFTLGVVPALVFIGSRLGSILRVWSRDAQEQNAHATALADEALSNVRTVRAFAMETSECQLYGHQVDSALGKNVKLGCGIAAFQGLSNLALNGLVVSTLTYGGFLLTRNELTPGDLMAFLMSSQSVGSF